MDTPSKRGRTVVRHPVPKAVRKRKKRARRRVGNGQTLAKSDKRPQRKRARQGAAQIRKPAKFTKQQRKKTFPKVAKAETSVKTAEKPQQNRAPKLDTQAQKSSKSSKQMQQPEREPLTDEGGQPLDYLKDGVVEWGIKGK